MIVLLAGMTLLGGCGHMLKSKDPLLIGTFPMGERVHVGPLIYTVLETHWRSTLSDTATARAPKNRFLLVNMTVTNAGGDEISMPMLTMENPSGQSFPELTEGVDAVPQWYGALIRRFKPAQTEPGTIVFDAPVGAYKLKVTDGGDFGNEKYAWIDMPVHIE
jgi:hypothetical protein